MTSRSTTKRHMNEMIDSSHHQHRPWLVVGEGVIHDDDDDDEPSSPMVRLSPHSNPPCHDVDVVAATTPTTTTTTTTVLTSTVLPHIPTVPSTNIPNNIIVEDDDDNSWEEHPSRLYPSGFHCSSPPRPPVVSDSCGVVTTSPHDDDDDDDDDCSMTLPLYTTAYSMVSSPQNHSPHFNNTASGNCSNSSHPHHHHHKSCLGFMICFLLALSLPIAYQQYNSLEGRNVLPILQHKMSVFPPHSPTQPSIVIVAPEPPYTYPTVTNEPDDDDDHNHSDDDDDTTGTKHSFPKIAWLMSFPGSLGVSHIIQSIEWYSQTSTATNYAATLLYPHATTTSTAAKEVVLVNPVYSVQPDDQCGPFIHRLDVPLPTTTTTSSSSSSSSSTASSIMTNTYCSTALTTSSSVVCTECIPTYHNALTFERACATGNRIYEQHYRSVQYDTRIPTQYIQVIQNPFTTLMNRLRITFQQKIRMAQQYPDFHGGHYSDFFATYIPPAVRHNDNGATNQQKRHSDDTKSSSISILDYCQYLDDTYALLAATTTTTDLLENYTHVPCHSEFYKYIQWYNDAVTLTTIKYNSHVSSDNNEENDDDGTDSDDSNNKPVHYIYYEKYVAALLLRTKTSPSGRTNKPKQGNDVVQDLLDFLNLSTMATTTTNRTVMDPIDQSVLHHSVVYESSSMFGNDTMMMTNYVPISMLQSVADMMYELSLPTTWELLRHYLEPYRSSNSDALHHHHFRLPWSKRKSHIPQSIPMSFMYDTKISDDSNILSPYLFDPYIDTLYENPFHEYDEALIHPPEPNDPDPQVVWLLSFPNSGTSYTINNLEVTCNVTTGSNYAKDWEVIVPVRPEFVTGPFIHNTELRVPHFVLTKTHCYGYCDDCGPHLYNITNNHLFEQGCVRAEMTNHTGSVHYANTVPVKAVHLYRSPFDNIVARMHLAIHRRQRQGNDVSLFTNSRAGVSAWCRYLDDKYSAEEEDFFSPTVLQLFRHVPCHADWYRYVQWHNHAYIMTEKLNLTVYDLFYEDYTHDYDRTVSSLFHYLNVTPKQSSIDFYVGKSYESFFDVDHARNAAILVQAISIPPVWLRLRHYFDDYM